MMDFSRLPASASSFRDLVADGGIYVDKTDLIADIAVYKWPFLFVRPRGFGKTTLVSTLEELFAHGLEKFQGLKIAAQKLWDDKTYPVLRLDFSSLLQSTAADFAKNLCALVKVACQKYDDADYGHDYDKEPGFYLERFLRNNEDKKFVLLIDNYDAPLAQVSCDAESFDIKVGELLSFFAFLKAESHRFRFTLLTGESCLGTTSPFSAPLNHVDNISLSGRYGALTGFKEEQIEQYFGDYLKNAAEVLNQDPDGPSWDGQQVLSELRRHYGGYCFERRAQTQVYNPRSVLHFLRNPGSKFISYRQDPGEAAAPLLANYLDLNPAQNKEQQLAACLKPDYSAAADPARLSENIQYLREEHYPLSAVLYSSGFLTVKRQIGSRYLEIGVPNLEAEEALAEFCTAKGICRD